MTLPINSSILDPYVREHYSLNDVSLDAFLAFLPHAARVDHEILEAIMSRGQSGATCSEIEKITGGKHQTLSPALGKLENVQRWVERRPGVKREGSYAYFINPGHRRSKVLTRTQEKHVRLVDKAFRFRTDNGIWKDTWETWKRIFEDLEILKKGSKLERVKKMYWELDYNRLYAKTLPSFGTPAGNQGSSSPSTSDSPDG